MPKVILGDVVERVKDKIDKDASDLEFYIGGEHFDYGEVVITKKSPIKGSTIGPAFHMHFMPGDVLLMSRNPHLRKAGMVDFEGICSDVSYVCRTKDETILLQRYLPFVLQTDQFWEFAEANKKGSTNFFLNWSDFARYEFFLPEIGRQHEITKLLWAAAETKASYQRLLTYTDELGKSQFIEMFGDPIDNSFQWPTIPLLQLGDCKNGMNFHSKDSGVEINCLGVGDFKDYSVIENTAELPMISLNETPPEEYMLHDGDIVFVRSNGNKALVGRCLVVYPRDIPTTYSGFCIRFRKKSTAVLTDYLLRYLKADSVRAKMAGRGANIQNLNQQILASLQVPIPPKELQRHFLDFVHQTDKAKLELTPAIENVSGLIKSLMQQDFSN